MTLHVICLRLRCDTSDAAHPHGPGGCGGVASDSTSYQQHARQLSPATRQPLHLEERMSGGDGEVRLGLMGRADQYGSVLCIYDAVSVDFHFVFRNVTGLNV